MYNKVVMVGNLTRDIDFKIMNGTSTAVAKSAIATSYKYKSNSGEQKDETCFLDFTIFGRSAEVANQYLKKGSKVLLEGRLVLEQWVSKEGQKRSKHILRVDTMKMLGGKEDTPYVPMGSTAYNANSNQQMDSKQTEPKVIDVESDFPDGEIPF